MRIKDNFSVKGRVVLAAYEPGKIAVLLDAGSSLHAACVEAQRRGWRRGRVSCGNLIVTCGKELVARMTMDEAGYDTGLTYCALGTSSASPVASDTTLVTETQRKAFTAKTRSVNEVTYSTYFLGSESASAIEEVGLFGHSTAGSTADSGVMMNRAALSYDNTTASPPFDLTIDGVITYG